MTGHYQATKTQKSEDVVLSIEVFFKIIKLTDTGLSWSQNTSCFFARQSPAPEKNIHLFRTFD